MHNVHAMLALLHVLPYVSLRSKLPSAPLLDTVSTLVFSCIVSNCIICAEMKDTPDAPKQAKKELEKLGPLSLDEKITAGAFAVTVGLWIFGGAIGINAVAAALLGLSILLITNVVKWKDCLGD